MTAIPVSAAISFCQYPINRPLGNPLTLGPVLVLLIARQFAGNVRTLPTLGSQRQHLILEFACRRLTAAVFPVGLSLGNTGTLPGKHDLTFELRHSAENIEQQFARRLVAIDRANARQNDARMLSANT